MGWLEFVSNRQSAERASAWLLAAAVLASALAVGTVHSVTLCIVTAALAAAAFLGWWGAEPGRARPYVTLLLLVGVVLTLYTLVQTVPVPRGLLARLAPYNADVWGQALEPLGEPSPGWVPLSLDPTATRVEVLRGVAYLLAFVAAVRVARRREGVAFLNTIILATAVTLAFAAVLHPAFGAKRVFGLYEPPPGIAARHVAPLLNPNNLAGYLNLGVCLSLAAAIAPDPRMPRSIACLIAIGLASTQVWVASRGGVITMCLGIAIVVVIALFARTRSDVSIRRISSVTALVATAGAILIVFGTAPGAADELFDSDVSKLTMFSRVMKMLPAVPFFGCGRGAFESAFTAFKGDSGYVTYTHPENVVAQWTLEWGLPLGLAALAAIAAALRPTPTLARSTTAVGAWAGLVALSVQNLGDLGTEIPGLMLGAVVCVAIVVGGAPAGRPSSWLAQRWAEFPRTVAASSAAVAGLAIILVAVGVGHELHYDEQRLYQAASSDTSKTDFRTLARAAILRHPAEPYLTMVSGIRAMERHDDDAMAWLDATVGRAFVYGPAQIMVARLVASRAPSQARMEYRLAMEQAPELVGTVMQEAPQLVGSYDNAMELVSPKEVGLSALSAMIQGVAARLPAASLRLDMELASRTPLAPGPAVRMASYAVADAEDGDQTAWCAGPAVSDCRVRAVRLAKHAVDLAPTVCAAQALYARALVINGDAAGGYSGLSEVADMVSERMACLKELVTLAERIGDDLRETEAINRLANAGCSSETECATNFAWLGAAEERRGNRQRAFGFYTRALEYAPDDDRMLETMARLAGQQGLHGEAADHYDSLARRHPADSKWQRAANAERDDAVGSVSPTGSRAR